MFWLVMCVSPCCFSTQAKSHAKRGIRDIKGRLKAKVSSTDLRRFLRHTCTSDKHTRAHTCSPTSVLRHTDRRTPPSWKQTGRPLYMERVILTQRPLIAVEACLALCSGLYIFNQHPSGYGLSCHPGPSPSFSFIVCIFHQWACDFLKANVTRCMFP